MVSSSRRRPPGPTGGPAAAKSLLKWTAVFLLLASSTQQKIAHNVESIHPYHSTTEHPIAIESPRSQPGRSPPEIPLLNQDVHTAKFRNTENQNSDLLRYQDASAPAQGISAVRAPPAQSSESIGLSALPSARLLQNWEAEDIILLSTIDGALHARDRRNGHHRWTLEMPDNPVVQTIHYPQNRPDQEESQGLDDYRFIVEPNKDGQLYAQYMDPRIGLVKLPATVRKMTTEVPFTMVVNGQYLAISSEQHSNSYTIDVMTGEVLYESRKHRASTRSDPQPRCRRRNGLEIEDPACKPGRTIRLGRNEYTFTISDEQTELELCTIKFSEWVTNRVDTDLQQQYVASLDGHHIQSLHSGRFLGIAATENENPYEYVQTLDGPVARIFDVIRSSDEQEESTDLVLLSRPLDMQLSYQAQAWRDQMKNSNRVFVNRTSDGHWYAMSEYSFPGVTAGAVDANIRRFPDGKWLDPSRDLGDIIGVHVLSQPHHSPAATRERLTLPSAPAPILARDKALANTDQQIATLDPPKTLAPLLDIPGPPGWPVGLVTLAVCGIPVLLAVLALYLSGFKIVIRQNADVVQPSKPSEVVVHVEKDASSGIQEQVADVLEAVKVTEPVEITPTHSRAQSNVSSTSSPRKKSVKLNEPEENGSDADSDDDDAAIDNTADQLNPAKPKKKPTKRGKRGGRKNKKKTMDPAVFDQIPIISNEQHLENGMVQVGRLKVDISEEKCLGHGSNGTAVYPGILDGREVAVKRLIKVANNLAEKEIKHLVSSDENPHVIRYFGKEESQVFFYIALDLFTTSLDQFIEHPEKFPTLVSPDRGFDVKDCLRQITDGVQHLHSLKLVHRDIKPQNVLVRAVKSNRPVTSMPKLQFVISDFGLCKPLEEGAMSTFAPTANHTAAGTTGWRAPELLNSSRDTVTAPSAESTASRSTNHSTTGSVDGTVIDPPSGRRATKAIDIFSLGCVFYYVMTQGGHPFDKGGSSLGRDLNIKENNFTTDLLRLHKYEFDADDLVLQMLKNDPKQRPDCSGVLSHPYFWTPETKLEFICLVSDCYEREKNSISNIHDEHAPRTAEEFQALAELAALETLAADVIGTKADGLVRDFLTALPKSFINEMGKQRKYTGTRMIDLLRVIRNKKNHFHDLPADVKELMMGGTAEGYYGFWTQRFPSLLINCHCLIVERALVEKFRMERWYA